MKKAILGGLIFIGGAIMYSTGAFGLADINVQAQNMQNLKYVGMFIGILGICLGLFGLKED